LSSFLVLGGVFLCVTGAEALYADMGHFGKRPIWLAWFGIVFPSLLLNYAGQAALILSGADVTQNIFFRVCPPALLVPLVDAGIVQEETLTEAFGKGIVALVHGVRDMDAIRQLK
ncbi:KUP/HAK/KT family potassium transporter, partial [Escherichia coli]|uniref:KUP/HAK/KT family potassium transporter n=1 Tax=Escherichia coli TaxID=562 RepID=UPI0022815CDD